MSDGIQICPECGSLVTRCVKCIKARRMHHLLAGWQHVVTRWKARYRGLSLRANIDRGMVEQFKAYVSHLEAERDALRQRVVELEQQNVCHVADAPQRPRVKATSTPEGRMR